MRPSGLSCPGLETDINKLVMAAIAAVALVPTVLVHAVVRTEMGLAESKAGANEVYRLNVPNEKPVATTEVRLVVPAGFTLSRFMPVPGWERTVVKDASDRIAEVTWKGTLEDGEFQRFVFQGRNPAEADAGLVGLAEVRGRHGRGLGRLDAGQARQQGPDQAVGA